MQRYSHTDELYHHGVKGMKWGVRRFRNKDGSLTPAGRKRYNQNDWSDDAKEAARIKKKSINQMSNAELRKLNERSQLERNYSQLNPSKVQKGMKYVAGVATATSTVLTIYNNGDKFVKIGKSVANKMLKK